MVTVSPDFADSPDSSDSTDSADSTAISSTVSPYSDFPAIDVRGGLGGEPGEALGEVTGAVAGEETEGGTGEGAVVVPPGTPVRTSRALGIKASSPRPSAFLPIGDHFLCEV